MRGLCPAPQPSVALAAAAAVLLVLSAARRAALQRRRRTEAAPPSRFAAPSTTAAAPPPAVLGAGSWRRRANATAAQGPLEFVPKQAGVPALSLERARRCLDGKHIVMLGDSITRYTFMWLVSWLDSGNPPRPLVETWSNFYTMPASPAHALRPESLPAFRRSPCWALEWGLDKRAYKLPSAQVLGGRMCCDCAGEVTRPGGREHRHYLSRGGARVSFFFLVKNDTMSGATVGHDPGCAGDYTGQPTLWQGLVPEIAAAFQARFGPAADAVVVAPGLWQLQGPQWAGDPVQRTTALAAVKSRMARRGASLVWMTKGDKCRGQSYPADPHLQQTEWSRVDLSRFAGALKSAVGCSKGRCAGRRLWWEGGPPMSLRQWKRRRRPAESAPSVLFPQCALGWVDETGHFQPYVYGEIARLLLHAWGC
eukprot:TRINITY_DN26991_c0_g1_i4.p1 TRINITY_DN26991_c0_g1~~TRINITY_DN26991_c0_g1_i4.p1  ORF type:complete len:423 (+),score=48.46 TRINITY_DN26991_c0_g1_i4:68-1336(+)